MTTSYAYSIDPIVTVITPTIPGREHLLAEAVESVRAQTLDGVLHLVELDEDADGPAAMRNYLLERVSTYLVAFLDDDDLLDPDHLAVLQGTMIHADASIAYSWPRVTGPAAVTVPRLSKSADVWRMMRRGRNVIPVTVLAKTSAIRAGGCFSSEDRYEDYSLWMRLHARGHSFACAQRETWTYRMLGENRTHA